MGTDWSSSLEGHRAGVRETIEDHTWRLVQEHGLLTVSMSQIAADVGVSRATLYKYFPDIEAILTGWHRRQVAAHLTLLEEARAGAGDPAAQLRAVLQLYAHICASRAEHGPGDITDLLHQGQDLEPAHRHLADMFRQVLQEAADNGIVRTDQPADQLTAYCLRALGAAADVTHGTDLSGLVDLVMAGLRPPSPS